MIGTSIECVTPDLVYPVCSGRDLRKRVKAESLASTGFSALFLRMLWMLSMNM